MRWNVYEWRHGRTWNIPAISTYCANVSEEMFLKPTKTFQKHFSVKNHSRKWILFLLTLKISPTWTRIVCPVHFTSCGNKPLSKEYSSDGVSRKLYFLQNKNITPLWRHSQPIFPVSPAFVVFSCAALMKKALKVKALKALGMAIHEKFCRISRGSGRGRGAE